MKKQIVPIKKHPVFTKENLEKMFEAVGSGPAMKLINGKASLHIYRNSTPHNWWVAPIKDEHDYIWHSETEHMFARKVPPLRVFKSISEKGFVAYPKSYMKFMKPADHGQPVESTYKLDYRMKAVWNKMSPTQQRELKKKHTRDSWN